MGLFPLGFPPTGPASRARRGAALLLVAYGAGVFAEVAAFVSAEPQFYLLPRLDGRLGSIDVNWMPLLVLGALVMLVGGLIAVRTRRAWPAIGLAVAALSAPWVLGTPVLTEVLPQGLASTPVVKGWDGAFPVSHATRRLPASTPMRDLVPDIARGELRAEVRIRTPGFRLEQRAVRIYPACRHAPVGGIGPFVDLRGPLPVPETLGDLVATCGPTCVLDVAPSAEHDADEDRALVLRSRLEAVARGGALPHERDALRAAALELRQYAHTHVVQQMLLPWHLAPFERIGKPFADDGLTWLTPRRYPDAPLQIIDQGMERHAQHISAWPPASTLEVWVRSHPSHVVPTFLPQATDATLSPHEPPYTLVVLDGIVVAVLLDTVTGSDLDRWLVQTGHAPPP